MNQRNTASFTHLIMEGNDLLDVNTKMGRDRAREGQSVCRYVMGKMRGKNTREIITVIFFVLLCYVKEYIVTCKVCN